MKYNAKEFEVKLEIEGYKPEDLNVKIVGDELSIKGKIKETDQHGTVTSEFSRSFTIPEVRDPLEIERNWTCLESAKAFVFLCRGIFTEVRTPREVLHYEMNRLLGNQCCCYQPYSVRQFCGCRR